MTLQQRVDLLVQLGKYIENDSPEWQQVKQKAAAANPWFSPEFIEMASANIAQQFLQKEKLEQWTSQYNLPAENRNPVTVGVVMAGNLPLVGFHDLLCVFVSGHKQLIKLSSKDEVLLRHLVSVITDLYPSLADLISFAENLKGCDAYIATGSNNTGRYFDYYFGKYPNIIRRNRTSVAILEGSETPAELSLLADDIQTYFGLGCRNVTKLYVPEGYNFEPLLQALKKYEHYSDFHKYRHNYDYQLALLMMGNKFYMTNESILLSENSSVFSAISQVHYQFYKDKNELAALTQNPDIQCIVGHDNVPFGEAQKPTLTDYADGVDTMKFLLGLNTEDNDGVNLEVPKKPTIQNVERTETEESKTSCIELITSDFPEPVYNLHDLFNNPPVNPLEASHEYEHFAVWFKAIAECLLNGYVIKASNDKTYRLREIEFYYHSNDHPDESAYGHFRKKVKYLPRVERHKKAQQKTSTWFFHYSGIDIVFGKEGNPGGILIRGIQDLDSKEIIGGSLVVLLELLNQGLPLDGSQKLSLELVQDETLEKAKVNPATRTGIGYGGFENRLYKFSIK